MKKFLTLEKTNSVMLLALVFFAASFLIHSVFGLNFLLYASGFFLALYIPGLAIVHIYKRDEYWLNKIIISPVFTIFIFIPLYYALTLLIGRKINFPIAIISICAVVLFSLIITYAKRKNSEKNGNEEDNKFIFFGIGLFIIIHLATTLVYKFIPEVDGYTDLMKIENIISMGIFDVAMRPLFSLLVNYISIISQIPPYWLFKFGMILIQLSGIYYLYQIIKIANIKSAFLKYLILISFVSVPVINLEIDYIRPNIIFIFGLLPFAYYLAKGLEGSKKNFLFSSLIALSGTLFHEFFGILVLVNFFFIFHYFYKQFNSFKRLILLTSSFALALFALIHMGHLNLLSFIFYSIDGFIKIIMQGIQWKWWFLNGYLNMDGFDLGWRGVKNVAKYYAYFLSPFLALVLLGSIFAIISKIKRNEKVFSMEKVALSVLFVGLLFAEFLPRINYKTLPDRFWIFISLSLVMLLPFTIKYFEKLCERREFKIIAIILLCLGIGGSVYVAKAKSGYVSESEYETALWIKENTPTDAKFISQPGNYPMIEYFAKRQLAEPPSDFFYKIKKKKIRKNEVLMEKTKNNINIAIADFLASPKRSHIKNIEENLRYFQKLNEWKELVEIYASGSDSAPGDLYVLYSKDKFNNYYSQRQWWRDINFYGADLEKFNTNYNLIYNNSDIIYIWKKK